MSSWRWSFGNKGSRPPSDVTGRTCRGRTTTTGRTMGRTTNRGRRRRRDGHDGTDTMERIPRDGRYIYIYTYIYQYIYGCKVSNTTLGPRFECRPRKGAFGHAQQNPDNKVCLQVNNDRSSWASAPKEQPVKTFFWIHSLCTPLFLRVWGYLGYMPGLSLNKCWWNHT